MKMKLSNEEIGKRINILQQCISNPKIQSEISGRFRFAISRNYRKFSDEAKEYLDLQNELHEKYGEISEDGKTSIIKDENLNEYKKEIEDIAKTEIEVDIFTIPEEEFYNSDLTSADMMALMWMADKGDET